MRKPRGSHGHETFSAAGLAYSRVPILNSSVRTIHETRGMREKTFLLGRGQARSPGLRSSASRSADFHRFLSDPRAPFYARSLFSRHSRYLFINIERCSDKRTNLSNEISFAAARIILLLILFLFSSLLCHYYFIIIIIIIFVIIMSLLLLLFLFWSS